MNCNAVDAEGFVRVGLIFQPNCQGIFWVNVKSLLGGSDSKDPKGDADTKSMSMQHEDLDAPADRHRLRKTR